MKRRLFTGVVLLAVLSCTGCKVDRAGRLIHPPPRPKIAMALSGTDKHLLEQKRIDLARTFTMTDGTRIDAWVIRSGNETSQGVVVLLHNLGDHKGTNLALGEKLAKAGYDVVLPDLRGHGDSGGRHITYGAREKQDVKAVLDELLQDGAIHEPVYAFGVSLGGAIAIEYAAIDDRCKGVMAISPPADAQTVMRNRMPGGAFFGNEKTTIDEAAERAGFDLSEASALAAAGKLTCPLLLVHGLIDLGVPVRNSQALLAAARGPKKLTVITPGPEQGALLLRWDDWIAGRIDHLARTGLEENPPPATQGAETGAHE